MDETATMPAGATWWRCALQVAPWAYLASNSQPDPYGSAEAYDRALVDAALEQGVQVLGFADHWRISSCESLHREASDAGLICLPGFEATSRDGIHVLVHFDPETEYGEVERRISECGIDPTQGTSEAGNLYFEDLLGRAEDWGAVCTAAHVTNAAGLLRAVTGQRRQELWRNDRLHSVAISYREPSQEYAGILGNSDPNYSRRHPPAVIGAADVSGHEHLKKDSASTWIKMASPTARGLDLAFRSHETRVRRADPTGQSCLAVESVSWSGGFLDDLRLGFNRDLNVLIGGRGTGKSTVLESLRAVLGRKPLTDRARTHHNEVLMDPAVLGRGTKIELTLHCVSPRPHKVRIERVIPSDPLLYDADTGDRLARSVDDVADGLEVYGQRELAEIADDPDLRTDLLRRFLPSASSEAQDERAALRQVLAATGLEILATVSQLDQAGEELSKQAGLEERLRLYSEAGVAAQLEAQAKHQTEDQILAATEQALEEVRATLGPHDARAWWSQHLLDEQGDQDVADTTLVPALREVMRSTEGRMTRALAELEDAAWDASQSLAALRGDWESRSTAIERDLSRIQRELQAQGADASDYLAVRRQVDALRQVATQKASLERDLTDLRDRRLTALAQLESESADDLRRLQRVGRKLSAALYGLVRVSVAAGDDRTPVFSLIRSRVPGRLDKIEEWLRDWSEFSPRGVAELARQGVAATTQMQGVTLDQVQRFGTAPEDLLLEIECLELTPHTEIELNIGTSENPLWRPLSRLSTGQKATALLLLLMLEEKGPLVIDQPEDDLDNQFIYAGIVPRLRDLKGRRQLIFASHNANIPVLGDADLITVMSVQHDRELARGGSPVEQRGSIDETRVRELVEELLEGGRTAFEVRRYRYGL